MCIRDRAKQGNELIGTYIERHVPQRVYDTALRRDETLSGATNGNHWRTVVMRWKRRRASGPVLRFQVVCRVDMRIALHAADAVGGLLGLNLDPRAVIKAQVFAEILENLQFLHDFRRWIHAGVGFEFLR